MAARDLPAGTVLSAADLTWKRPAHGISAGLYDEVIGRTTRVDIAADELLQWRLLD